MDAPGDTAAEELVTVSVLGEATARRGGEELSLGAPKQRAVIAALGLAEGRPVDLETLTELVWSEQQRPANPVAGLHVYISVLRRVLEPPRAARARPTVLVTSGGGYALSPAHVRIDVTEVALVASRAQRLLGEATQQVVPALQVGAEALEATLAEAEAALDRWRGEPYLDLVETVAVTSARARVEGLRTSLLHDRAVAQLSLGRHGEAAGQLGALVIERPLDERLWSLYAVALARSGRQADALEALRTVRERLVEELGVDPGAAIRQLEAMVLRQDPALTAPRPASQPAPPSTPPAPAAAPSRTPEPATPRAAEEPAPAAPDVVGRSDELALLRQQLDADGARLVQVIGEAGIGKSTLAGALAAAARERGDAVWIARCPEDEGTPPLWPWTELVGGLLEQRVLSRDDLPAPVRRLLDTGAHAADEPAVLDPEVARFRLFEALADVLVAAARRRPVVAVVEDLHWADPSTARFVAHLGSRLAAAPASCRLLLAVTRRPEHGSPAGPGASAALDALARHGTLRLDLTGLAAADVATLARRRTRLQVDDAVAAAMHRRTAGNPFLLGELLRLGDAALLPDAVPGGVRDVIQRRLAALPSAARSALVTAAVVGAEFDLTVVADVLQDAEPAPEPGPVTDPVAGRDDGTGDRVDHLLDALDPAIAAGLVVDTGAERMTFAHALTRDAVYDTLAPTRRFRQHAAVAAALEARERGRGTWAAEVARHWLAAGPRHASRAWRAAREAGLDSERRFAVDEAAALLDLAMTAQSQDDAATANERFELARAACTALLRAGLWARFLARVEEAALEAERLGKLAWLVTFAIMPAEAGPWTPRAYGTQDPAAIRRLRRCLDLLPSTDSEARCRVMLALGSELYFRPGTTQERTALVEEGLAMARRLGDPALQGRISQRAALVVWRGGNADLRLRLATESVDASGTAGDTDLLQTALGLRMSAAMEAGRIGVMEADIERAAALLEERPLAYPAVVLACLQVPWLAAQGRYGDAQARFDHAARLGLGSELPWAGLALGTARVGLAVWRGDLGDPDPALRSLLAETEQVLPVVRLLVELRTGNVDGVRAFLAGHDPGSYPDNFTSLFQWALAAEAAYVVDDPGLAADAYAALAPYAGQLACAGTGVPLGPVDSFLALAAAATGDLDQAAAHGDDAAALMADWGLGTCAGWLAEHRRRGGWEAA